MTKLQQIGNFIKLVFAYAIAPAAFIVGVIYIYFFANKRTITGLRQDLRREKIENDFRKATENVAEADRDAAVSLDEWKKFRNRVKGRGTPGPGDQDPPGAA